MTFYSKEFKPGRFGVFDEDEELVSDEESDFPAYLIFDTKKEADDKAMELRFKSLTAKEMRLIRCALHAAKHTWSSLISLQKQAKEAAVLEDKLNGE